MLYWLQTICNYLLRYTFSLLTPSTCEMNCNRQISFFSPLSAPKFLRFFFLIWWFSSSTNITIHLRINGTLHDQRESICHLMQYLELFWNRTRHISNSYFWDGNRKLGGEGPPLVRFNITQPFRSVSWTLSPSESVMEYDGLQMHFTWFLVILTTHVNIICFHQSMCPSD